MTNRLAYFKMTTACLVVGLLGILVLMLIPLPDAGYLFGTLVNFLHVPLFAVLAFVAWMLSGYWMADRPWAKAIVIWMLLMALGLSFELLQMLVGRMASWRDMGSNMLGAGITLFLLLSTVPFDLRLRKLWRWGAGLLFALSLFLPVTEIIDVIHMQSTFPEIASFDRYHELSRWSGGNVVYDRSNRFATSGEMSLKIQFKPHRFSGIWLPHPIEDWSDYTTLAFEAKVPDGKVGVPLIVQLEDANHDGTQEDRFRVQLDLQPGEHQVKIPLSDVKESLSGREFDLSQVRRFQLMVYGQKIDHEIYVDSIRLE